MTPWICLLLGLGLGYLAGRRPKSPIDAANDSLERKRRGHGR